MVVHGYTLEAIRTGLRLPGGASVAQHILEEGRVGVGTTRSCCDVAWAASGLQGRHHCWQFYAGYIPLYRFTLWPTLFSLLLLSCS